MFYELQHLTSPEYYRKEYGYDLNFPPHLHYCFELVVILSGEMTIKIDSKEYLLKKGDAALIFPNQLHSFYSKNSKYLLYIFTPELVKSFSVKHRNSVPEDNRLKPEETYISLLDSLGDNSSIYEIKGILYSCCGIFDKSAQYISSLSDSDNLLSKIFSFVEENYTNECSLKKLSAATGYDYSYLSRYFKKITGISYNDYLNAYRLNNAGHLLRNSDITILRCAEECGYTSLRTFNRNFKDFYGTTPMQYKKQN